MRNRWSKRRKIGFAKPFARPQRAATTTAHPVKLGVVRLATASRSSSILRNRQLSQPASTNCAVGADLRARYDDRHECRARCVLPLLALILPLSPPIQHPQHTWRSVLTRRQTWHARSILFSATKSPSPLMGRPKFGTSAACCTALSSSSAMLAAAGACCYCVWWC